MFSQIKPFAKWVRQYFRAYGGWSAVLCSPLFLVSIVVTALNYSRWVDEEWIDTSLTLLPGLLGFSLGTYAILFSLVSVRLKSALRAVTNERGITSLHEINANFFHFIFIQVMAIFWAFLFSGTVVTDIANILSPTFPAVQTIFWALYYSGAFVGYLLMIYSLAMVLGAAMTIYRLALIKDPADDTQVANRTMIPLGAKEK